jgi:hypothetical protein
MSDKNADGILTALIRERGAVVSSADCSEMEIAHARVAGRFFVDPYGYGFVLRPKAWRERAEGKASADPDPTTCPKCGGSGGGPDPATACGECDGTGWRPL